MRPRLALAGQATTATLFAPRGCNWLSIRGRVYFKLLLL
jgi:hypothetical protein